MVVSSAFFARSAQSAQNVAADCGVTNAIGVRCFRLTHVTPKSVFAMPRAGKVRDVICASAPHHGHGQRDTPSGVGMVSGGFLLIDITAPPPVLRAIPDDTQHTSVYDSFHFYQPDKM